MIGSESTSTYAMREWFDILYSTCIDEKHVSRSVCYFSRVFSSVSEYSLSGGEASEPVARTTHLQCIMVKKCWGWPDLLTCPCADTTFRYELRWRHDQEVAVSNLLGDEATDGINYSINQPRGSEWSVDQLTRKQTRQSNRFRHFA